MAKKKVKSSNGNCRFIGPSVRVDVERDMRAFDKLPPELRAALRVAICDSIATGWTKAIKVLGATRCAEGLLKLDRDDSVEFVRNEFGDDAIPLLIGANC